MKNIQQAGRRLPSESDEVEVATTKEELTVIRDILDYKQSSNGNIAQDRIYELVATNVSDLIGILNLNGQVVYASRSHNPILGIDPSEYVGKHAMEHIHPDDLQEVRDVFDYLIVSKKSVIQEFRYRHADGHYVTVEAKAEPVLGQSDEVECVVIVARDITMKQRSEKLLKGQNKILNLIARGTPVETVLNEIVRLVESHNPTAKCGIFVTKEEYVLNVSPSLPKEYTDFIEPYLQTEYIRHHMQNDVVFTDMKNDPEWQQQGLLYDIVVRNNLAAMWSKPINAPNGEPVGIFGIYYHRETYPIPEDIELYEVYGPLAALAIDQHISITRIAHLDYHDTLTGLPNRRVLETKLNEMNSETHRANRYAVMALDLDRIQSINDTFGYQYGDRALQVISKRLSSITHQNGEVFRNGGDEFAVLVKPVDTKEGLLEMAHDILRTVSMPIELDDHEFQISTSIGIAFCPEHGTDSSELLKNAHTALYEAKVGGRNTLSVYQLEMNARKHEQNLLERELRQAVEREEFELHYQPKYDAKTKRITGAEALIRWLHPVRGIISPAEFIPMAEETGLITTIGSWVLQTIVKQLKVWELQGKPLVPIAVNVSAQQLVRPSFPHFVRDILIRNELDPRWLELEITETTLITHENTALKNVQRLADLGVSVMLDDFGTGFASLSYLTRFAVKGIKIDRSFINGLQRDDRACEVILIATLSMAKNLGLKVVAEGVETEKQLHFLKEQECDEVQGYLLSKPLPLVKFEAIWVN